jgi:16S rRNA (guanine527-N7)-methyltransferase
MDSDLLSNGFGLSQDEVRKLEIYAALLRKWNPSVNLVSPASLASSGKRHFADSLQLMDLRPSSVRHWADLGSGGGFPGMVIGILASTRGAPFQVTLVESDHRKAVFLETVSRETNAAVRIVPERIEACEPLKANVVSARALAPLGTLLGYADRHLAPNGTCLFLKGEAYLSEIADARKTWCFDCDAVSSKTAHDASILRITEIRRV